MENLEMEVVGGQLVMYFPEGSGFSMASLRESGMRIVDNYRCGKILVHCSPEGDSMTCMGKVAEEHGRYKIKHLSGRA